MQKIPRSLMQRGGFLRNHAKWFVRHQNWLGFLICNFTTFKFPAWPRLWRPLVEFMSPISRKWELGKSWNSGHSVPRQGREVPLWILFIATFFAWPFFLIWNNWKNTFPVISNYTSNCHENIACMQLFKVLWEFLEETIKVKNVLPIESLSVSPLWSVWVLVKTNKPLVRTEEWRVLKSGDPESTLESQLAKT